MSHILKSASNHENRKDSKISENNNLTKSKEYLKSRSEVIHKLIKTKEHEKEESRRKEKEMKERDAKRHNTFRIPKKKPEQNPDVEKLINSLFDDSETCKDSQPSTANRKDDKHKADKDSSSRNHSASGSSHKEKTHSSSSHGSSHSSKDSKGSTSDKHSSSAHSSKDSKESTSDKHSSSTHNRHSKPQSDPKLPNSSKQSENKSSASSADIKSSSSLSDHSHKSKSGSGNSKSHDPGSSQKDKIGETKHSISSSSLKSHASSSSKAREPSSSKPEQKSSSPSSSKDASSGNQPSASEQLPVVLNKHHLNPVVERQATSILSEKEKILARLQAIRQRTLEAIHKENSGKGKRAKGERSQRKSKAEVKHDDKAKSVEIVRDIASSEDEDEVKNDVPSALDIMLSERKAKLEKEQIARMAKQAWERATKKDEADSDKEVKVKKKRLSSKKDITSKHKHSKSGSDDKRNNNKKYDRSASPSHDAKKLPIKPKKPVIIRHSVQSAAPPMDFKAILEMAEKKQKEPPKPLAVVQKKKKEEEGRPLTQEEKDRKERQKSKEYQNWLKFGGKPPAKKYNSSDEEESPTASPTPTHDKKHISQQQSATIDKTKIQSGNSKQSFNRQTDTKGGSRNHQVAVNGDVKKHKNIVMNENVLVCGPGSDDEESQDKAANPFDRIMNQFQKKRPAQQSLSAVSAKKGRFLDSEDEGEEEYDAEMDDFIDDGEEVEPDYSTEIKKLFGYDKSKYKFEREEDLSDMEADYATVMKEEKRSAKLGLMEDLEDMKREQEELKRKAMLKKRK